MTAERDDYMRRQEAEHDLLRMRDQQTTGRGSRFIPPAQMQHVVCEHGEFIFPHQEPERTPSEKILLLLANAGVETKKLDHVMPAITKIIAAAQQKAFEAGSRDAQSRATNKPGDGDMGG